MSKDISIDLIHGEGTKVHSTMKGGEVARMAVPILDSGRTLWELQIVVSAENSLVGGTGSSAERAEIEAEFEAEKRTSAGRQLLTAPSCTGLRME